MNGMDNLRKIDKQYRCNAQKRYPCKEIEYESHRNCKKN